MKNDKSEDNSASEVIPEVKTPLQGGSTDVMTDSCSAIHSIKNSIVKPIEKVKKDYDFI